MAQIKKTILIVLVILAAVFLLSVLQIAIQRFNNPIDQPAPDIVGNACMIWGTGENESAVIPAQASLTRKHYVFGNHEDGICLNSLRISDKEFSDGYPWIYWVVMQDGQGAAMERVGDEDFNFFFSSADMDILIFGVCDVSCILDDDSISNLSGKKALMVLPADDSKAAWDAVKKACDAGWAGELLKEWLAKNHLE